MKETKVSFDDLKRKLEDCRYANQAAINYWQKARDSKSLFSRWIYKSIAQDLDEEAEHRTKEYDELYSEYITTLYLRN